MVKPINKAEFIEYCLRKLGKPVIEINVSEDQIEDRVDQGFSYYRDFSFDASDKTYYKHTITQTDVDNKYITLPENIIGAVRVFSMFDTMITSADYAFDVRYQIALNDLYSISNTTLVPYYMNIQHLSMISELLVGEAPIRYTRHSNKLYVDTNWKRLPVGKIMVIEAYDVIDPEIYTDVWGDRWLQNYCTALIKQQWGQNLSKFENMSLPGGVQFNGSRILNEANQELKDLEDEMRNSYSIPTLDAIF